MTRLNKPLDILDRYLESKTPVYNNIIKNYIRLYGKNCTYYVNPNKEGSSSVPEYNAYIGNRELEIDHHLDNYTLAFGKDNVGFDYSKLDQKNAFIIAEYQDYYRQSAKADDNVQFYLQVEDTDVSRGDIISYVIGNNIVFYRIAEPVNEYFNIVYRIDCRLIQVKELDKSIDYYDVDLPEGVVIL